MSYGISGEVAITNLTNTINTNAAKAKTLVKLGPLSIPRPGFLQSKSQKLDLNLEGRYAELASELRKRIDDINAVLLRASN